MEHKYEITYKIPSKFSDGKLIHRLVDNEKEMYEVTEWLDSRIKFGTCLGYIVTLVVKERKMR